jgi:hypothetical protein
VGWRVAKTHGDFAIQYLVTFSKNKIKKHQREPLALVK